MTAQTAILAAGMRASLRGAMPCDQPLAGPGFTSYRYDNGRFGWVMIGAKDDAGALSEAARSVTGGEVTRDKLQVWDAVRGRYRPVDMPALQLEFWIPEGRKGGRWMQIPDPVPGLYKTWRRVIPGHSHADKLAHSIAAVKSGGHAMSADAQCDAYLAWARAKGLQTVSVYAPGAIATLVGVGLQATAGKVWYGARCAKSLGFQLRAVDPADIHGDAPAPEVDSCDDEAAERRYWLDERAAGNAP